MFYAARLADIKEPVESFDADDATAIKTADDVQTAFVKFDVYLLYAIVTLPTEPTKRGTIKRKKVLVIRRDSNTIAAKIN